ncbi:hypothetical protein DRO31_04710 [Candidatus Bathyarchaeota archaeon]|nr:MAG: hypothetical protein DRO31_04710 [Candidatus Bathyarchaeota archaeon]
MKTRAIRVFIVLFVSLSAFLASQAWASGGIIGSVKSASDNSPIPGVTVFVNHYDSGDYAGSDTTDQEGHYTVDGLDEGQYRVWAYPSGTEYLEEYYNNVYERDSATAVQVTDGSTTSGIDFLLELQAKITGTVRAASDNTPLAGFVVTVEQYNDGSYVTSTLTDSSGLFVVDELVAGTYRIRVSAYGSEYVSEYYDGVYDAKEATPVSVSWGDIATDINFLLESAAKITGTVTSEKDGSPIPGIWINITKYNSGDYVAGAQTDASGSYQLAGLPPGTYRVEVQAWGTDYLGEFYPDTYDKDAAAPVSLASGGIRTIYFELARGGVITGFVKEAGSSLPLGGFTVCASNKNVIEYSRPSVSKEDGSYTITGLYPGDYIVCVQTQGTPYVPQCYDRVALPQDAIIFHIGPGDVYTGVDFYLSRGGGISGVVTREKDGVPIPGLRVSAIRNPYVPSEGGSAVTQANGSYLIQGLSEGLYYVYVDTSGSPFFPKYYNNVYDPAVATQVQLTENETTTGIDFSLANGGEITGMVLGLPGPTPLKDVSVIAIDSVKGESQWSTGVLDDGSYVLSGLPPGTYKVLALPHESNFLMEYYYDCLDERQAYPIEVDLNQKVTGIDFYLNPGGSISGTVSDQNSGAPIGGITVCAEDLLSGQCLRSSKTEIDGSYTISSLPTGQYVVRVSSFKEDYVQEYYDNVTQRSFATPVAVTAGSSTQSVDFSLSLGGKIRGQVTEAASGEAVFQTTIELLSSDGSVITTVEQGPNGTYEISGIPEGTYFIGATPSGNMYLPQYYSGAEEFTNATPLDVLAGQTLSDIDFSLVNTTGCITGTVRSQADGLPLAGVYVTAEAYNADGFKSASALTGPDGSYIISGLKAGTYSVLAYGSQVGYIRQYYNGVHDSGMASPVTVTQGNTTSSIDFDLKKGSEFTGTVRRASDQQPIAGITVLAQNIQSHTLYGSVTDTHGFYSLKGLRSGEYYLWVDPQTSGQESLPYLRTFYPSAYEIKDATLLVVTEGTTLNDLNFSLEKGGSISGRVIREPSGIPVSGLTVEAREYTSGGWVRTAKTAPDGTYYLVGLLLGEYRVRVSDESYMGPSYDSEYYNDTPFYEQASPVTVTSGGDTGDIDFSVELLTAIEGTVKDSDTGLPIPNIEVKAVSYYSGVPYGSSRTDNRGFYRINGLRPGYYKVWADCSGTDYITQYYADTYYEEQATPVEIFYRINTVNVDFQLEKATIISGTVYNHEGNTPITDVGLNIIAYQPKGCNEAEPVCSTKINSDGTYMLKGLAPGTYIFKLSCQNCDLADLWWTSQGGAYRLRDANQIEVQKGVELRGIDFRARQGGRISGTIVSSSGVPLLWAVVSCFNQVNDSWKKTYSQFGGAFELNGLSPGVWRVKVQPSLRLTHGGFMGNYYLAQDEEKDVGPLFVSGGAKVSGRVIDEFGNPPYGASATFRTGYDTFLPSLISANGSVIGKLLPGSWVLGFSEEGYFAIGPTPVEVPDTPLYVITFGDILAHESSPTNAISGVVSIDAAYSGDLMVATLPSNLPLDPSQFAKVLPMDQVCVGEVGAYEVHAVPNKETSVFLLVRNFSSDGQETITVRDRIPYIMPGNTGVNLSYDSEGYTLSGYAANNGEHIFNVLVLLYRTSDDTLSGLTRTDHDGTYAFFNVPAGSYKICIYSPEIGGEFWSQEILVNQDTQYDFGGTSDIKGDIEGDGDVDGTDLAAFASAFGSSTGDANFNPACDLYEDGLIDEQDLEMFVIDFGH